MDPMSSAESETCLLDVARRSIEHGVTAGEPIRLDVNDYPEPLRIPRATFVTLHRQGELRGCMGALEASRPLVSDVAHNAHAAAFRDPRFAALTEAELADLEIHLSILSPLEPLPVANEPDLLRQLRPGIDGLVVRDRTHQGTFLPSVWESLNEPAEFVRQLKHKAGLPQDAWSDDWEVLRYTVDSIPRDAQ
jgi:AmmeMemoRadiSam system protein A